MNLCVYSLSEEWVALYQVNYNIFGMCFFTQNIYLIS